MNRAAVLERLGLPGIAGAVLLLLGAILYAALVLPLHEAVGDLQAERARLASSAQAERPAAAAPVRRLPSFTQAPDLLKQLNALAQRDGVTVTRSSYQVKAEDARRIFEVDLPLKVAYPTLRSYLRDVVALAPTARLDDLNLHRAAASDPLVDADVRLSFSFAAAP